MLHRALRKKGVFVSVLEADTDTDPGDYFSLFIFFLQIITGVDVSVSCPCLCPCLIGLNREDLVKPWME